MTIPKDNPVDQMVKRRRKDPDADAADHEFRIKRLESGLGPSISVPFTFVGAPLTFPFSPKAKWTAEHAYDIYWARLRLGDTAETAYHGRLWINLTDTLADLYIGSGEDTDVQEIACAKSLVQGDYVTTQLVSGGSAEDWVFTLYLVRTE